LLEQQLEQLRRHLARGGVGLAPEDGLGPPIELLRRHVGRRDDALQRVDEPQSDKAAVAGLGTVL
jgi:hypothetical protein